MDISWISIISAVLMGASAAIVVLFFVKHESLYSGDVENRGVLGELERMAGSPPAESHRR